MKFHQIQTFPQIDDLTEKIRQFDDFLGEQGCNDTPKIHCKNPLQNPALDGKNSINVILTEKTGVVLDMKLVYFTAGLKCL